MMNRARSLVDGDIFVYSPVRYSLNNFPLSPDDDAAVSQGVLTREPYGDAPPATEPVPEDDDGITPEHTLLSGHVFIDDEHRVVYDPVAKLAVRSVREHRHSRTDFTHELAQIALYSGYSVLLCVPLARHSAHLDRLLADTGIVPAEEDTTTTQLALVGLNINNNNEDADDDATATATAAADMRDAHALSQARRFQRLAAILLPDQPPARVRNLSADDIELRRLYDLKIDCGLLPAEPLDPDFLAHFFDKPRLATTLEFLRHTCTAFLPHPNAAPPPDANEAEFHMRLRPCPRYFVWALRHIATIMLDLGLFTADPRTHPPVHQTPFVTGIRAPTDPAARVLPPAIRDTVIRHMPVYHIQFNRALAKHTLAKEPTTQTLCKLYAAAMRRIGVSVARNSNTKQYTPYKCTPTDACELFLAAAVRPVARLRALAIAPVYSIDVLTRLSVLLCHCRPQLRWTAVHGITHQHILDVLAADIAAPPPTHPALLLHHINLRRDPNYNHRAHHHHHHHHEEQQ